ncbi:MAG: hypothetical protein CL583_01770 [Alteromonadaceae bacterium]|nr:hypothetical protein [Alteromonadaceae bacterium]|tara:strand:+ start:2151 stop:3032 length:882 start_codon:yes stop_codon:yes gene_type:complete
MAQYTATVQVEAVDETKPVITLLGANPYTLTAGEAFTDPGATASDDVDGDLSAQIQVSGSVDTSTPDTYTLTYSGPVDSSGNVADPVTRTVVVVMAPVAVTIEPQSTTDNTPTLTGTVSREDVELSLTINDQVYSPAFTGTTWTQTTATLPIGTHPATITATDSDGNTDTATAEITIEPTMAFVPMYSTEVRMSIKILRIKTDVDIAFSVVDDFEVADVSDMTLLLKKNGVDLIKTLNNGISVYNGKIILSIDSSDIDAEGEYEVHGLMIDQQGKRRGLTLSPDKLRFEKFLL